MLFTFTPEQLLRAVKGWCWDCGDRMQNYIVHNEVWAAAWADEATRVGSKRLLRLKKEATKVFPERPRSKDSNLVHVHVHLCFGCLELRLGRRLRITDFLPVTRKGKPVPENAGIFLGYQLGYRAGEKSAAKKEAENGDKKDEGG